MASQDTVFRGEKLKKTVCIYEQRAMQTGERGTEMGARPNPLPLVIWKVSKVVRCSRVKSRQTVILQDAVE